MLQSRIAVSALSAMFAFAGVVGAQQPDAAPVRVLVVAEKLGVQLMPNAPLEIEPGRSSTTTLVSPKKLAPYGIEGMHEGARVTITCIGPNRVRVEAEELMPVEQKVTVTLRVNDDGTITQVPKETPKPKPAPPERTP